MVVLLVAAGGAGAWWFLRDDAPAKASLGAAVDAANKAPDGSSDTATAQDSGTANPANTDPAGEWTIDESTRSSDVEGTDGTYVGFRIAENLANVGSTTAVGRTGDVSGTITLTDSELTAAELTVDMTNIETDRAQRKGKIRQAIEADRFPTATFELTEPIELPAGALNGEAIEVTAHGDLTIHGVTKAVEIPLDAQLVNDRIAVAGSLEITFSDFGVEVPQSPIVLSVDDHGTLELQLIFKK